MTKQYLRIISSLFVAALLTSCGAESPSQKSLTIASYNVRNARGIDDVADYRRTAGVIDRLGADVVAVQEIDSVTGRSGGEMVLDTLAMLTGMHSVYAKAIDYDGGGYGIGVLSKEEPSTVSRFALAGREEGRVLLVVEFADYILMATHLSLTADDRMKSINIIDSLSGGYNKPVYLAGDLNATPGSPEISQLTSIFTILSDTAHKTYPADRPEQCIDYILIRGTTNNITELVESGVADAPLESDHRPVFVRVKY